MTDEDPATPHIAHLLSDAQDDIERAKKAAEADDRHEVLKRSLCAVDHLTAVSKAIGEYDMGDTDAQ